MLIELEKTSYDKVWPLFQGMEHNQIFFDALFEENHAGKIFVDDRENPSTALAALACEFFFMAGRVDNPAFNTAMRERILSELVPTEGDLLFFPTSEAWKGALDALFADFKLLHVNRKAFTFYQERFKAKYEGWQNRVPEGYTIRRYDQHLSEGLGLAQLWGSLDRFLENGVGFAVLQGEEVVSRCHSVLVGNDEAEISIETSETYRRQGFATLAACAFIEYCIEHALRPAWSCWDNNIASQILAQKLGFNHPVDIPAIYTKVK